MRDVLAGIEALVADGLADPARLGLTGGSYGGYLTNWILGHDDRFAAAMTCRSVSDMPLLFLTGDLSSGFWPRYEFGTVPWEDPAYYREISPITYADAIRTPLLIQHSENDIRTTIGQAEELFTVLRSHRRPVRLLRVPEETHELTRSGTPFRRAENLKVVRDWFRHFLVEGKRALPPLPKVRGGRYRAPRSAGQARRANRRLPTTRPMTAPSATRSTPGPASPTLVRVRRRSRVRGRCRGRDDERRGHLLMDAAVVGERAGRRERQRLRRVAADRAGLPRAVVRGRRVALCVGVRPGDGVADVDRGRLRREREAGDVDRVVRGEHGGCRRQRQGERDADRRSADPTTREPPTDDPDHATLLATR